jgi:intracellular proteinase inhibitor BsuPI
MSLATSSRTEIFLLRRALPRISRWTGPGFFLLLTLALSACSIEPRNEKSGQRKTAVNTPRDSLNRELVVPATAAPGSGVPIVLRVTNIRPDSLDLSLQGREIAFDVIVTDEQGAEVYHRLAGQQLPAILQLKTLRPGESLELSDTWKVPASAGGEYVVNGEIKTDAQPILFRPVRIRVSS